MHMPGKAAVMVKFLPQQQNNMWQPAVQSMSNI
jgi:hypothetical protein